METCCLSVACTSACHRLGAKLSAPGARRRAAAEAAEPQARIDVALRQLEDEQRRRLRSPASLRSPGAKRCPHHAPLLWCTAVLALQERSRVLSAPGAKRCPRHAHLLWCTALLALLQRSRVLSAPGSWARNGGAWGAADLLPAMRQAGQGADAGGLCSLRQHASALSGPVRSTCTTAQLAFAGPILLQQLHTHPKVNACARMAQRASAVSLPGPQPRSRLPQPPTRS